MPAIRGSKRSSGLCRLTAPDGFHRHSNKLTLGGTARPVPLLNQETISTRCSMSSLSALSPLFADGDVGAWLLQLAQSLSVVLIFLGLTLMASWFSLRYI